MPFFRGTPHEVLKELRSYTLKGLKELNHLYGPYFERLEERIDQTSERILVAKAQLESWQVMLVKHKATEGQVNISEELRQNELRESFQDNSVDNILVKKSLLSYSPRDSYDFELNSLEKGIREITREIEELQKNLVTLKGYRTTTVQELKLVNRVIEEKETELLQVQKKLQPVI